MDKALFDMLREKAKEIRKLTIREIGQLTVGHIGGAVDLAELLAVLYYHAMNVDPSDPKKESRDRFILSKGHGGPALYSVLAMKGYICKEELDTLNLPGTNLPSHCDMNRTNGIDMTTGSLGQGVSCAAAFFKRVDLPPPGTPDNKCKNGSPAVLYLYMHRRWRKPGGTNLGSRYAGGQPSSGQPNRFHGL